MNRLENKVAVVTGASKGIGVSIAMHLAAEGASVVVNYLTGKDGADRVVAEIAAAGGKAIAVRADVSSNQGIAILFGATKAAFGRVDILVNNAGVHAFGPLESVTAEAWHREFNLNVLGLLLTTQAALRLFPETGGSVINIGSRVSTVAPAGSSVSAASKAAVDAITKSLSKELGSRKNSREFCQPGSGHDGRIHFRRSC
jgi:3-oxoacyl-[acyl-carrier protein] reductase